ncbi:MAG: M23 family metallopeptidase [Negativicutes bacterium]|nr:M23 family metallopeptidase [Negativicutes bacterium]
MPDRLRPTFLWLKELGKLGSELRWLAPAPVYAATAMVLVASVLMLAVVGGVKYVGEGPGAKPDRQAPAATTEQAGAPAAAAKIANETPAATQVTAPAQPERPAVRVDDAGYRPLAGETVLGFGWQRHPVFQDWRYHTGVDIKAQENDPVRALYGGEVSSIYEDKNTGLTVAVNSGAYTVYYGSLAATALAKGDKVAGGAKIGTVGSLPNEPFFHLHLAVKSGDKYINPEELLIRAK